MAVAARMSRPMPTRRRRSAKRSSATRCRREGHVGETAFDVERDDLVDVLRDACATTSNISS